MKLLIKAIIAGCIVLILGGCTEDSPAETVDNESDKRYTVRLTDEEARLVVHRAYYKTVPEGFTNNKGEIQLSTGSDKFKEEEFKILLESINDSRDVKNLLNIIYGDINARVNFGNAKAIQDKDAPTWTYIYYTAYMDERLYLRMAEVMAQDNFTEAMNKAASLVTEIKQSNDVEKLKSLYQVLKDQRDRLKTE